MLKESYECDVCGTQSFRPDVHWKLFFVAMKDFMVQIWDTPQARAERDNPQWKHVCSVVCGQKLAARLMQTMSEYRSTMI